MKITKQELQQIIKEETAAVLAEKGVLAAIGAGLGALGWTAAKKYLTSMHTPLDALSAAEDILKAAYKQRAEKPEKQPQGAAGKTLGAFGHLCKGVRYRCRGKRKCPKKPEEEGHEEWLNAMALGDLILKGESGQEDIFGRKLSGACWKEGSFPGDWRKELKLPDKLQEKKKKK